MVATLRLWIAKVLLIVKSCRVNSLRFVWNVGEERTGARTAQTMVNYRTSNRLPRGAHHMDLVQRWVDRYAGESPTAAGDF